MKWRRHGISGQEFRISWEKKSYISLSVSYRKSYGCSLNECKNEELGILESQNLNIYEVLPQLAWGLTVPPELQQIQLIAILAPIYWT